jgi:hypothetical protein
MNGDRMRSSIRIGGVILALTLLVARETRADNGLALNNEAAMKKASALLWDMSEWHHEFSDRRLARGITPDKERVLAQSAAAKFAGHRDKLAALVPKLPPGTRFTTDLERFVQTWPTRDAFLQDLVGPAHGEKSGLAITSLAMQVSDPRRGWKTLFPFFRP